MSEYMTVEVKGLSETFKKLGALGSYIQKKAAVDMTSATSGALARAVRKNCPVKSGNLRKSIRSHRFLKHAGKHVYYEVGFTVGRGATHDGWYAHIVEFGSKPHIIPWKGRAIPLSINGHVVMGPVNHPGIQQPSRFVTRSFEENYPHAIATGQKAFEKALIKYRP